MARDARGKRAGEEHDRSGDLVRGILLGEVPGRGELNCLDVTEHGLKPRKKRLRWVFEVSHRPGDQRAHRPQLLRDLVRELFDASDEGELARKARIAQIPAGRMGRPEDVAEMALYLASQESSWVTGVVIPLDGGLSAY